MAHGEKISKISLFVLAQLTNVTDGRTNGQMDTACRHILRLCIASRGKNDYFLADLWSQSEFRTQRNAERKTDPKSEMTQCSCTLHSVNPLEFRGNYSATSNNMKLVHWPLMGGL